MLVMYFDQLSINSGSTFTPEFFDAPNPSPHTLTTIPPCTPRATDNCTTIAYAPSNDSRVVTWIQEIASRNSIPSTEILGFTNEDALNSHFLKKPNTTQGAYVFDAYSLNQLDVNNISFIVQYNASSQREFPIGVSYFDKDIIIPAMVHQMHSVILEDYTNRSVNLNLNISVFPHPNLVDGETSTIDAFSNNGAFLTFATYFITLVFFLYRLVTEKERGLRDAMRLAGQSQFQHYVSWTLPFVVVNLLVTLLLIAFGAIFRFSVFLNIEFLIYFLTMFIFSLAMIGWTMLIASLISKSLTVSSIAFNIFIFGYILGSAAPLIYDSEYTGPEALKPLFAISPITTYIRAMQYIAAVSNLPVSPISMSNIDEFPEIFSIRTCWSWMFFSGLIAFMLSLYFDNIISTPHGSPLSPIYFLQSTYWFPKSVEAAHSTALEKSQQENSDDDEIFNNGNNETTRLSKYDPSVEDEDVLNEREAVASGERNDSAIVVKNLTKKFGRKMTAVDDVSFSIPRNSAFVLLGHNGAGKSTIFKMLTTTLSVTSGDATIYGLSVRKDRTAIRKLLGVCPQFDTYWDRLTGAEHIRIFSALKGLSPSECEKEIGIRLNDVDLLEKQHEFAGKYSGGMQRRLSVAISLTGDPRVVFLDECTSGADPLVRRDLWTSLQRAKQGRVIFMITHSIAEAQYIAGHDSIGIMAQGKLRVLGNAMHLKSKFGAGHSVVVVLENEYKVESVTQALKEICDGVTLKDGGVTRGERGDGEVVATFLLPRGTSELEIFKTVEILENDGAKYGVRDYSIDSTSLGEVFKSITSLSEDKKEKGDEE